MQLIRSPFIATAATPATGYAWIDFSQSGAELNFFVPITATGVTFQVRNPANNASFTPTSTYTSWDRQYNIYTANAATVQFALFRFKLRIYLFHLYVQKSRQQAIGDGQFQQHLRHQLQVPLM